MHTQEDHRQKYSQNTERAGGGASQVVLSLCHSRTCPRPHLPQTLTSGHHASSPSRLLAFSHPRFFMPLLLSVSLASVVDVSDARNTNTKVDGEFGAGRFGVLGPRISYTPVTFKFQLSSSLSLR